MTQQARHPQFPLDDKILYFNHAAVSPWPRCAADAVHTFTQQNLHTGSKHYLKWLETEQQLRKRLCWLINADSSEDIALLKNTSEGLSVIAYGLDWQAGDNVVIPAGEFPSNRIVWESLAQYGVETRQVDMKSAENAEQALLDAIDARTRLLSVSAVQYSNGFRLDLEQLGAACANIDTLFVVDAIQQLGALPFDQQRIQADFVVADGHKWMMGPEGLALFYSKADARDQLQLKQYGWHMVEHPTDFLQKDWQLAKTSQRFECGSPNMLGVFALNACLGLIQETGKAEIEAAVLAHTDKINSYIDASQHYELLIDPTPHRRSGITNFKHRDLDNHKLHTQLTEQGVQCAERGLGVRLSPHFYQQAWEFERLFSILDGL